MEALLITGLFTFQSTLLMRGATDLSAAEQHKVNFNPRSSCEERLGYYGHWESDGYFNPRSSCEERLKDLPALDGPENFNPRSSCEERLATSKVQTLTE